MRTLLVPRGDNFEQRGSRPFHVRFRQRGFSPAGRRVLGQSPNKRRTVGFGAYADGQNAVLYGSVRLLRISKNYPYSHFVRLRMSRFKRWVSVLGPAFRLRRKAGLMRDRLGMLFKVGKHPAHDLVLIHFEIDPTTFLVPVAIGLRAPDDIAGSLYLVCQAADLSGFAAYPEFEHGSLPFHCPNSPTSLIRKQLSSWSFVQIRADLRL